MLLNYTFQTGHRTTFVNVDFTTVDALLVIWQVNFCSNVNGMSMIGVFSSWLT